MGSLRKLKRPNKGTPSRRRVDVKSTRAMPSAARSTWTTVSSKENVKQDRSYQIPFVGRYAVEHTLEVHGAVAQAAPIARQTQLKGASTLPTGGLEGCERQTSTANERASLWPSTNDL
jgi:hypothetical protein